jgi:hypothetical protein
LYPSRVLAKTGRCWRHHGIVRTLKAMSLFQELKRRNVIRVGIAYAVTSWLVMQVSDVVIDNIGAPDWLFKAILLLLGIGFPLVMVFAWAFELTPEGIKREKDVDRTRSITSHTGRKLDFTIIALLVLGLGYFIWESRFSEKGPDTISVSETECPKNEGKIRYNFRQRNCTRPLFRFVFTKRKHRKVHRRAAFHHS